MTMAFLGSNQTISAAISAAMEDAYTKGMGFVSIRYDSEKDEIVTTHENVIASAKEGEDAAPKMPDLERVARAIVSRLGLDPDALAFSGAPVFIKHNVHGIAPYGSGLRPVWTFFTAEADAALGVLDI